MSVELRRRKIVQYPNPALPEDIVALPEGARPEELTRDFDKAEVAGVIPHYQWGNWELNATTAVMVRGALRRHRILAPIPAETFKEARNYLETFAAGGFDAFVLPELVQEAPVQHKAGFWMMSGVLKPHWWIHLAGGKGIDIPADVPGEWSWSAEGL